MNIEKIKNYNQKMLAVASTLGIILLLVCITMMVPELLRLFSRSSYNYDNPTGLIADDKVESLNQENLRKQIVAYGSPWLIDTLKSVYIIPVSITTLKKPEEIPVANEELMSLMDVYPDFSSSKKGYYNKRHFDGGYTNLILYYPLENKTLSLFNERIFIGGTQAYYFKDDILLVFYSAEKDTDKNGIIDLNDTRNLCVYSLNTGILKKISDGDNSLYQYQFIENTKDLLVEFSLNQYNEKQFNTGRVPSKIMRYKYDSQQLTEVIPQTIQADMQKLIEGK
ncbi:MAG: hypothetical protein LBI82_12320 [Dysgonamonadaceae bacterium]|jgi:hypothetical protein|nr:hypothetical protein [Dysgonamonadaceae bacterium]